MIRRLSRVVVLLAAAFALPFAAAQDVLFDNGGMVTHPGEGAGGADVSMAGTDITGAGSNVRLQPTGDHFRIADDFTVTGTGWNVAAIVTHGYETNSATPTWSGANLNVWDGSPDDPASNIVASTTDLAGVEFTGIYRVFNGAGNLGNTARPIHALEFTFDGGLSLGPGTYWIDWQVEGGVSGWAPYVMEPNPDNPNSPTTILDNGLQLAADGWQPISEPEPPGVETPFLVLGTEGDDVVIPESVPVPALSIAGLAILLALFGLIAVMVLRRRST